MEFFDAYQRRWKNIDENLFDYYNPDKNLLEKLGIEEYLSKVKKVSKTVIESLFKKSNLKIHILTCTYTNVSKIPGYMLIP